MPHCAMPHGRLLHLASLVPPHDGRSKQAAFQAFADLLVILSLVQDGVQGVDEDAEKASRKRPSDQARLKVRRKKPKKPIEGVVNAGSGDDSEPVRKRKKDEPGSPNGPPKKKVLP